VLYGAYAYSPLRLSAEQMEPRLIMLEKSGGTGVSVDRQAPSKASDEVYVRAFARFERLSASPAAVSAILRMNQDVDVRHLLGTIRIPTLVLHRSGDMVCPIDGGRYIAEHIPGARFVELPGVDRVPTVGDPDRIIDEMEEFLTGSRSEAEADDRVLATVLFTDIVESTKRAAELGDREWHRLLNRHHETVRQQFARFRGREVKSLGDGFLATFDGPARAVRCASAIAETVQSLGLNVRTGVHTGEIELHRDDIGGIAVHIAARVAATANAGETLVSSTVRDLVPGSGLRFEDRGRHALRGLPEEMHLYSVLSGQ
jgi:class 3 adenylate cyclase